MAFPDGTVIGIYRLGAKLPWQRVLDVTGPVVYPYRADQWDDCNCGSGTT